MNVTLRGYVKPTDVPLFVQKFVLVANGKGNQMKLAFA